MSQFWTCFEVFDTVQYNSNFSSHIDYVKFRMNKCQVDESYVYFLRFLFIFTDHCYVVFMLVCYSRHPNKTAKTKCALRIYSFWHRRQRSSKLQSVQILNERSSNHAAPPWIFNFSTKHFWIVCSYSIGHIHRIVK